MVNYFYPLFKLDNLNGFVALAVGLFLALTVLYSLKFMKGKGQLLQYYTYIILTAAISIGALLSNNLILLLVFWGFLGLTLYLLINMGEDTAAIAKKTFIIVGGSDAIMLLGIGLIYYLTGTFQMDSIRLEFNNGLSILAYLCIAVACFAKAGAMPFHSWIPDCSRQAPVPVVAYLLASLDKLLGIYLLARISLDLFVMNEALNIFLMLIGAFTIIAAVMMALVQHNMKKLLGYHAVSQVGYMVLGIGTGNPIGIAGGIFHMLNNSIYKQNLFLVSGNVEKNSGTTDLDKLGGLSKTMPFTYISALIASLSISGVPPFNGFVSKWMVYQGLISKLQIADGKWQMIIYVLCLAAAMFGSGLTLASFMKLIHAVFLGQPASQRIQEANKEVHWTMWLPCVMLALSCVIFGVFAYQIPLKYFIIPAVQGVVFTGTWYAGLSTLLIIIGLCLGLLIFRLKGLRPSMRQDTAFMGGETSDLKYPPVTGTEFYNSVRELELLRAIYKKAEAGFFDIYDQGKKSISSVSKILRYLHNGILPTYMVWYLLGMLGLFYIFLFK
ncbi:MAG: proton-conducting transporter membrane subunit [Candidatus Omnitrophota bacterium]